MIAHIQGTLAEALPPTIVIDVGGVGYEVTLPLNAFDRLPRTGGRVRVLTHYHHVRENAPQLFGFLKSEERDLFRLLLRVTGIGPRVAVGILGAVTPVAFKDAVVAADSRMLARLPGIGKKTADRLIVELRDQLGVAAAWQNAAGGAALAPGDRTLNDAVLALIALGYKQVDAHKAAMAAREELGDDAGVDHLVRSALQRMSGRLSR